MTDFFFVARIEFERDNKERITTIPYLENNISFALKTLFGEVGSAIPFKVLKYESKSGELVICCPGSSAVKVRTALTLQSTYQGETCTYHILKSGNSLLDLQREIVG